MEEKFEGPLPIKSGYFEFLAKIVSDFAKQYNLDWWLVGYPNELEIGRPYLNSDYYRLVRVSAFLRGRDTLLFFTPFVCLKKDDSFAQPPNEKSLLFPLGAFYRLSQDEQKRVVLALLEAAWKEAQKLDENDVFELLEKK